MSMLRKRLIHHRQLLAAAVKRMALLTTVAACPVSVLAQAPAADPAAFQAMLWATSCMACHGPDGRAEGTGMTIGGRPAQDLLVKLRNYKNGTLPATIMHHHVRGYSDDELARIAEYFSRLK